VVADAIVPLVLSVATSIVKDVGTAGLRRYLAQRQDLVGNAIQGTSALFPDLEGTRPALFQWTSSEAFIAFIDSVYNGDRFADAEFVSSFINDGGFYLPIGAECEEVSQEIVIAFLRELSATLYRSDEGIPTLANRIEVLHEETRGEFARQFGDVSADLKADIADIPRMVAQAMALAAPNLPEMPQDAEHTELSKEIDFAAELINRGLIGAARRELERIESQVESIPDQLKFRIITNLGACALAEEDNTCARALFEQAHSILPGNQKGLANAALAAQLANDAEAAISLAEKARELSPQDSQATSVLIEAYWGIGSEDQLEELVASEDWIRQDYQCLLALASVRMSQCRWQEAVTLCRLAIDNDSKDAYAHLALSQTFLKYAQAQSQLLGFTKEAAELLDEADAEATYALTCLSETQINTQILRGRVIRACARVLLGKTGDAIQDFDAVLMVDPTHADAAFNKGLLLLQEGKPAEARQLFERIQDPDRREDAEAPLAEACLVSGDASAAVRLLRGKSTIDCPCWDDIHRAEILCQAEAKLGEEDSLEYLLKEALLHHPSNSLLLTLDSTWRTVHDDVEGAEKSILLALECSGDEDHLRILIRVAAHFQATGKFSEAADWWGEIVGGSASQPVAIPYLACLVNSKQLREALEWARKIQENQSYPPRMVYEVEAQILQYIGDVRAAVRAYQLLCGHEDSTPVDQVMLALAQLQSGDLDAASVTVLNIDSSDLGRDPRSLLNLAKAKLLLGVEGYLQDGYVARRCGMDDPQTHLGFFLLFQSRGDDWKEPETIGPGCAVLLKGESTEQWWHILEWGEESQDRRELTTDHELALKLRERKVGDVIMLRHGLEDLSYEVVAIQSKFARAFQEISEDFSTRFPDNTGFFRMKVAGDDLSKLFETVEQRNKFCTEMERLYAEGTLPFGTFASQVGMSALEAWKAITLSKSTRIRFSSGNEQDASEALTHLQQADGLVLDAVALLTVHHLGLGDHLRNRYLRVAVPQQVIDDIQQLLFQYRVNGPESSYLGMDSQGRHRMTEMPLEHWLERRDYVQSVLHLAQSFERIAGYRLLDYENRDELFDVLTAAGVGAAYAGDEHSAANLALVCDDLVLANYSRTLGVSVVNTQVVLTDLYRSQKIDRGLYSSYVEELAGLNYWFIRVAPEDLVQRLETNGYMTTAGIHAMLNTLAGPDCTQSSAVSVGAKVIIELAAIAPLAQVELVLSAVMAALRRGRALIPVLLELRKSISEAPTLSPYTRNCLLQTIDLTHRLSRLM